MASHSVDKIKVAAIVLANDLRSGLTVYLTKAGNWSEDSVDAWCLTDDVSAEKAMNAAAIAEGNNQIIGPYLVDATSVGQPTHIRERLRVDGPSINY